MLVSNSFAALRFRSLQRSSAKCCLLGSHLDCCRAWMALNGGRAASSADTGLPSSCASVACQLLSSCSSLLSVSSSLLCPFPFSFPHFCLSAKPYLSHSVLLLYQKVDSLA